MASPRPWRTAGLAALAGSPVALAAGLAASGWLGAGALLRPSPPRPSRMVLDLESAEALAGPLPPGPAAAHQRLRLVLRGRGADEPGMWGLTWQGGHGVVGPPRPAGRRRVARTLLAWWGNPPSPGDGNQQVRRTAELWPEHAVPQLTPADEVEIPGPLGPLPAWLLPPSDLAVRAWTPDPSSWWPDPPPTPAGDTWLIAVHGRASSRAQALRVVRTLAPLGCPALCVSYRNDPGAPGDGRCRLGHDEWADVEAAMAWAVERGARRLILAGWSMGGSIAVTVLQRSALADRVAGVLLDAPVLDWAATVNRALRSHWMPPGWRAATVSALRRSLQLRAALDWAALKHATLPTRLNAPVLLVHGSADALVPVETSDALAAVRPDLVTYLRVGGAGHVDAWNHVPGAYDGALASWLRVTLEADAAGQRPAGVGADRPVSAS